jgi:hypothetical protein
MPSAWRREVSGGAETPRHDAEGSRETPKRVGEAPKVLGGTPKRCGLSTAGAVIPRCRPPRAPGTAGDLPAVFTENTVGGAPAVPGRTDGAGRFLHQEAATAAHPRAHPTHLRRWPRPSLPERRTPAERRRPWTRRPSSLQIVNELKGDPTAFPLQGEGHERPFGRGDPHLATSFVSLHFRESLRRG